MISRLSLCRGAQCAPAASHPPVARAICPPFPCRGAQCAPAAPHPCSATIQAASMFFRRCFFVGGDFQLRVYCVLFCRKGYTQYTRVSHTRKFEKSVTVQPTILHRAANLWPPSLRVQGRPGGRPSPVLHRAPLQGGCGAVAHTVRRYRRVRCGGAHCAPLQAGAVPWRTLCAATSFSYCLLPIACCLGRVRFRGAHCAPLRRSPIAYCLLRNPTNRCAGEQ